MTVKNIPDEHHVVRYVAFGKLRRDEDDNVVGVLGAAFKRRDNEDYLSAAWLEYFSGDRRQKIIGAIKAFRYSLKVGTKSGFVIGQVEKIKNQCSTRRHKIRIVHEPTDDNKAHVAVRRIPVDDSELLELLAAEEWSELILNKDIESGIEPAPDEVAS